MRPGRRGIRGSRGVLAVLATAWGCASAAPSAVVTLATDVPACRLPTLRIRCAYDWDGASARDTSDCEQVLYRGTSPAQVQLPASFGLRPSAAGRSLTLVVDDAAIGRPALRRTARMTLGPGASARVLVVLRELCAAELPATATHPCPAGEARCTLSQSCEVAGGTCGNDGLCRPIDLVPAELGGVGNLPDAGPDDACGGGTDR